jgi:hypothetical protein
MALCTLVCDQRSRSTPVTSLGVDQPNDLVVSDNDVTATTAAQQIFIDKVLQAQLVFYRGRVTVHHVSDVADAWRA